MPAKIDYDQNWGKFSLAYNWKYPDALDIADLVSGGKIIVQEPQNVDFLFPVLLDQKVKQCYHLIFIYSVNFFKLE